MKLTELYQYIKIGILRTDLTMVFKIKNIKEFVITRVEDGSENKEIIRFYFDEKAELEKTDFLRIVCHNVEREILQSIENRNSWRIFQSLYYIDITFRDDAGQIRTVSIIDVPDVIREKNTGYIFK